MKKIAFSLVALLTFTGCQRQDLSDSWVEDTKIEKMEEQNTKAVFADTDLLGFLAYSGVDTKISPQRAKEIATQRISEALKDQGTLTKGALEVEEMFVVEDGKQRHCVETKAGEGEGADYYIINFSGDNGYVIVGADETYGEVIGYETHGKIGKREEMKEAEKYVFELIDNYVQNLTIITNVY